MGGFVGVLQVLSRSGTPNQRDQFSSFLNIELGQTGVEGFKGSDRDYVRLRGVPFSATPEDVIAFFGDLKGTIAKQGVHMVLNAVVSGCGE